MAKMVTRSVIVTECKCKVFNVGTEQVEEITVSVVGNYRKPENLVKAVERQLDGYKLLVLKETVETVKTYGVSTEKFMEMATEIKKEKSGEE